MRRIGIIGGTFNPPHNGHLMMANEAYDAFQLDEVRFMPNAIPPHKLVSDDATVAQRKKMTELAILPYAHFKLEPYELEHGGVSYTFETMKAMTQQEPDTEFYFIIGGDMIDSLERWYEIEQLVELVHFVGFHRPGSQAKTNYPIQMIDAPIFDLSSTLIRNRIKDNRTVTFLIPEVVEAYIREEGLYGATRIANGD